MSSRPRSSAAGRLVRSLAVAALAATGAVLPVSPAAADEPGSTLVGELVQAYPEQEHAHGDEGGEAPLSWVRTAAGESVRVPTEDVADLAPGSTVAVAVGDPVDDDAADDGYEPAHEVLDADLLQAPADLAPAAETLTNQVTVAMVVPPGGRRDGVTLGQVVAAVDGPVAGFWAQQSGGAIRLGVTAAHDWLTTSAGCEDPTALWREVAQRVGFVAGPGRHLVVYVSSRPEDLPGCSYALGQVGRAPASGGSLYVRDAQPSVLAHELGHNFGLGHSSGLQCDSALDSGTCRTEAYRDYYDVMGASWSRVGALTAAQADRLGVLPASARVDLSPASPSGTWTLAPLAGSTGPRAIRLTAPDGTAYWLEYRSATGQDAWLGTRDNRFRLQAGVLLHRAGGYPDTSLLLDGTPGAASGWDDDLQAALPVGTAIPVAGGAFTVTVQALGPEGATLGIAVASAPVVAAAPAPAEVPAGAVLPAAPAGGTQPQSPSGTAAPAPEPAAGAAGTAEAPVQQAAPAPVAGSDLAGKAGLAEASDARPATDRIPLVAVCVVAVTAVLLAAATMLRLRRRAGR